MKKWKTIALLIVVVVLASTSLGFATKAFVQGSSPSPAPIKVKVIGEDGKALEIQSAIAKREGDIRTLDHIDRWTLRELGYKELVFPCSNRFEAISTNYLLPDDAAQGPDTWYILRFEFTIDFSEDCQDGRVEIAALTNDAACGRVLFNTGMRDGSLSIQYATSSGDKQCTTERSVQVSTSGYLRDALLFATGVKPGQNTLTFRLAQYGGAKVDALRVSNVSSIEVTTSPPPGSNKQAVSDLPLLSSQDAAKAQMIAMADANLQEILCDKEYTVSSATACNWPRNAGNARLDLVFKVPQQISFDWPWPPNATMPGLFWVRTITIAIDLDNNKVTGISPVAQPFAKTGSESLEAKASTLTEAEKIRAKEIVLNDPEIRELLAGRVYEVACRYGEKSPDTLIGVWETEDSRKLGAALEIWFQSPIAIRHDWPIAKLSESDPLQYSVERTSREITVSALCVSVDLAEGKVVQIAPLGTDTREGGIVK